MASSCQIGTHVQAAILLLPHLFKISNYKLVTKHNLINYLKQTYLNDHPKCCTLIILKKTQWQLSRIFWLSSQDYLVITFVLFRIHYTENRQIEVLFNRINRIWSDEHNMSMSNTFKCQITAFLHTFHFFLPAVYFQQIPLNCINVYMSYLLRKGFVAWLDIPHTSSS